jgi:hypothetical protein
MRHHRIDCFGGYSPQVRAAVTTHPCISIRQQRNLSRIAASNYPLHFVAPLKRLKTPYPTNTAGQVKRCTRVAFAAGPN